MSPAKDRSDNFKFKYFLLRSEGKSKPVGANPISGDVIVSTWRGKDVDASQSGMHV